MNLFSLECQKIGIDIFSLENHESMKICLSKVVESFYKSSAADPIFHKICIKLEKKQFNTLKMLKWFMDYYNTKLLDF